MERKDEISKLEQGLLFDPKELPSPMEAIRVVDGEGREWWNSRQLANALGYGKYWNFEHLIEKVLGYMQSEKGLVPAEHVREIEEMTALGQGRVRLVKSKLLSKVMCHAIVVNADKKKPMVKVALQYFTDTMTGKELAQSITSNIQLYRTEGGKVEVSVIFNQDTFWLTQQCMAQLFGVDITTINYHLQQVAESGELDMSEAIRKFPIPSETSSINDAFVYNLDAITAVGFRVNSYEASQFRKWAMAVLKEYMVKGFVLNDERLKGRDPFGADYFDQLLIRIQEIRNSEKRVYQQLTDIYADCSYDYDPKSPVTKDFYAMVQNMMHYAVAGQTAAEIVYHRADAEKPHMGLMTWAKAPHGRVSQADVIIAKNYLDEHEVQSLNLLTSSFLDTAELKAQRHQPMAMLDWAKLLRDTLMLNDYPILEGLGTVSHEQAEQKALEEYDKFKVIQDRELKSDFDLLLEEMEK